MNDIIRKIEDYPRATGSMCAGFLFLYFLVNTMTLPLDHNEHMYVTAGYLMRSMEIYRDFAFVQTPYLPILYDGLFRILRADHLLLVGRLTSLFFTIASCALLWLIVFRRTKSYAVSHISVMIFGCSYFIQDISGEAANYMMPMAAILLAALYYQHILEKPELRLPKMYCLGLILAVATGAKLYYSALFLPFLICTSMFPRRESFSQKFIGQTAPLVTGFVVGLIPMIHYVAHYAWSVWFNNVKYHILNLHWRGFNLGPNIEYRFSSLLDILLTHPSNLAFVVIFALILVKSFAASGYFKKNRLSDDPIAMLSAMSIVVGVFIGITPLPMFVYYFAAGFPFAVIFGCCLIERPLLLNWSVGEKSIAAVCIMLMIGSSSFVIYERLGAFRSMDSWTPFQVHQIAKNIKAELGSQFSNGNIATLSPLYAVEAKLKIYPQFSTGPFVFRIGNQLTSKEIVRVKGVSPLTLDSLLKNERPSAIIVGQEPDIEAALKDYGKENGFREADLGAIRLFVENPSFSRIENN